MPINDEILNVTSLNGEVVSGHFQYDSGVSAPADSELCPDLTNLDAFIDIDSAALVGMNNFTSSQDVV